MRCLFTILMIGLFCVSLGAVEKTLVPEEAVREAERDLWGAYSNHNVALLEKLLANELTFTKENGYLMTKAQELKTQEKLQKKEPNATADALAYQVEKVRMYENTAITNGYFVEKDEQQKEFRFHFTNTWVKQDGRWQVAAIQITQVSEAVLRKLATK